jgi:hypothetical protein
MVLICLVQVDILHPLASLDWRECKELPALVGGYAHAVWLKDKVYVGGGWISGNKRVAARLYIYIPATDTWTTLDTPVCRFGLTTYHSQLVLVGGREYVGENVVGELTNKLWTLSEDGQWQETLPPMPIPCHSTIASAVSHGDHLLVISGFFEVYVYNGHHWATASEQHPPQWLDSGSIGSTVFNGHWYVMARILPPHDGSQKTDTPQNKTCVYSASLNSLLASCHPSETSQPSSLWKRLTNFPSEWCCPAVYGNRLVAIGERSTATSTTLSLYAYSSLTQSWVHMGDSRSIPISFPPCAVLLPSNELMIVSGRTVFQSRLTCKFNITV